VNYQLYRGWRLGKLKSGIVSDGEGLVEATGESIELRGVGFSWCVRVGACEGDSASVIDLWDETLREEARGFGEAGSSYVGEGGGYILCKGVGSGFRSGGKETS